MQSQKDSTVLVRAPAVKDVVFVTTVVDQHPAQLGPAEIKAWKPQASAKLDWEGHKSAIKRLYIGEGRKLKDVIEMMRRDAGFDAT